MAMDFRLFRGITTDEVVAYYAKHPRKVKIEAIPGKFNLDMVPSPTRRNTGTLQKAIWRSSQMRTLTAYAGDELHLVVICKAAPWLAPDELERQNYAIAVRLEHAAPGIQLYNDIRQAVQLQHRVRL